MDDAQFEIAPLREHEWTVLRDLRLRALADAPDAFGPTLADAQAEPDAYWQEGARRFAGRVLVARDGSRTIGLVSAVEDPHHVGHLGAMWVDPATRGRGLGRRLVERACQALRARGCQRIELSVTQGNQAAQRLYERFGFACTGESEPLRPGSELRNLTMALVPGPTTGSA